ncbi:glycine cleavage system aminomethyltransferase GcvT [Pseudopontixanthobacter vadosimaris]|uniref:glycine cleavage system aminomethyltransferase GcvT n=1 Tax=Pseudopontixanthobacter vadosimaris TaxID=2726450 RepID=UPI001473A36C|nr:glycine cleavage system aminomethyltransferase GcvT [Pseudopontixanthobacter vadosimaris]
MDTETETAEAPETGTLPLDAWHRANGARMVEFAGYSMPIQYTGIVAEHDWTRESAGLFDVSHMGQLTISSGEGAEENAATALERLLPGNIAGLKPGRMRYSLLLNDDGGILDDLIVTNLGSDTGQTLGIVVNGAMKWDDIAHLREHLPDAITLNLHDDRALLALQGPKAAAVLDNLVPGTRQLTFMTAAAFEWQGVPLWVSRAGYTGEDGFEISLPEDGAAAFADALIADDRVKPVGLGARDSLRLEAGLPLYGHDLSPETDPVSAGLGFALSKKRRESGGWMGHGTCVTRLADGCAERRVGLVLSGRLPAREGAAVMHGETQVGRVTSGGFSPTLGHPVAMAYVASEHAAEGTELTLDVRGRRLDARVAPMPFVPHKYYRGEA